MNFKKLSAIILTFVMLLVLCPTVSAATDPIIVVSGASANPGDEVTVNISISNNPGIMAMTFSVTYDQNNLEFLSYIKGWISTPTYKDHADKGYVAFCVVESSAKQNVGSIMSLKFKIKEDAKPGKYQITLGNHYYDTAGNKLSNCFSDASENYYTNPQVNAGSITVLGPCNTSGHTYGEWVQIKNPTCNEMGLKERTCSVCGEVDQQKLTFVHDFEYDWTVDKVATPEENGVMSRHCKLCDETTDRIVFSYEEIETPDDEPTNPDDTTSSDVPTGDDDTSGKTDSTDPSDDASSGNEETKKPVIDNTEGAKNPLEEVEKLEDFENLPQPEEPEDETPDKNTSENITSNPSSSIENTDDTQSNVPVNTTDESEDNPSFLSTPTGIITIVICALLSCGIVALGIILILKNRKNEISAQDNE